MENKKQDHVHHVDKSKQPVKQTNFEKTETLKDQFANQKKPGKTEVRNSEEE